MADKIEIEVDADASDAIGEIGKLNKGLKKQEGVLSKLSKGYAVIGAIGYAILYHSR